MTRERAEAKGQERRVERLLDCIRDLWPEHYDVFWHLAGEALKEGLSQEQVLSRLIGQLGNGVAWPV